MIKLDDKLEEQKDEERSITIKKLKYSILKNNLIFLIGTILLVFKGLFLNYSLNLPIGINVVLYTIVVSLLIMCPTINKKNKLFINVAT